MAMMISWVKPVHPSHPYLENDPAPWFDSHHLRISPWLEFRFTVILFQGLAVGRPAHCLKSNVVEFRSHQVS